MKLGMLLRKREDSIRRRWLERIVESYPEKTAAFLKQKRNQFANPVGHILKSNVEILFRKFVEEADLEEYKVALDEIVRVRSVQTFSPSQAISFVYLLKDAIRSEVWSEIQDRESFNELARIEDRIDELACEAFDLYMQSREQIYELRVSEIKRTGFRLLHKAKLIDPGVDSESAKNGKYQ